MVFVIGLGFAVAGVLKALDWGNQALDVRDAARVAKGVYAKAQETGQSPAHVHFDTVLTPEDQKLAEEEMHRCPTVQKGMRQAEHFKKAGTLTTCPLCNTAVGGADDVWDKIKAKFKGEQ